MVDQLPNVSGDGGAQEATPVVLFKSIQSGGGALDTFTTVPSQTTYTLAAAIASLAASGTTAPVTGLLSGSYIWAYVLGGTTPSLVLEALGPDGTTYQAIATVTASGVQGVVIGANATVRLRNAGANAVTGLSSNLS